MTTLKLQYSNYEEGEFTKEQSVDYSTFIEIFEKETNNIVYSKYSWSLENDRIKYFISIDNVYFLIIEHIARDGYKLFFFDNTSNKIYINGFYKSSIEIITELFFTTDFETLRKEFKIVKTNIPSVINRFKRQNFEYIYNDKVVGQFALTLFIYTILPLFFLIIGKFSICIFLTLFLTLNAFFLCWIHYNHLKESKNISIKISSGNEEIVVTINNHEYKFLKNDIKKMKLIFDNGKYSPFTFYNYSQIVLNNGSIINITNMIIEPTILVGKLKSVEKENRIRFFPYINLKTNIIS